MAVVHVIVVFAISIVDIVNAAFPGYGLVVTTGGARIPLRQIRAGDSVLVVKPDGLSTYFDTLYSISSLNATAVNNNVDMYEICLEAHRAERAGPQHANNRGPLVEPACLDVTADHLVFDANMTSHRAREVKVGQLLRHVKPNGQVTVSAVRSVVQHDGDKTHKNELYTPLTYSGTIVVNDVVASTYVMHHTLNHAVLAPKRVYYATQSFLGHKPWPQYIQDTIVIIVIIVFAIIVRPRG